MLRNIGIIAHIDAGKTTTTEKILHAAGVIKRAGNVDSGDTIMDFLPQERERGITIQSAAITFPWREHIVNLIDTPGHVDFGVEVARSLRVMDGCVCVIDASQGVEPQTRAVWELARRHQVTRIIFINKIDKVGANVEGCLASIQQKLQTQPFLMQSQINSGVVSRFDLADRLAEYSDRILIADSVSTKLIEGEIAALTKEGSIVPVFIGSALRDIGIPELLDGICKFLPPPLSFADGILIFKLSYPANNPVPVAYFRSYMSKPLECSTQLYNLRTNRPVRLDKLFGCFADELVPMASIPPGGIGALQLNDDLQTGDTLAIRRDITPFAGVSVPPAVFMQSVEVADSEEQDRLEGWLNKLTREDPSLQVQRDETQGQLMLAGLGKLHLEIVRDRLCHEIGLKSVELGPIRIRKYNTIAEARTLHNGGLRIDISPLPLDADGCMQISSKTSLKCPNAEARDVISAALNSTLSRLSLAGVSMVVGASQTPLSVVAVQDLFLEAFKPLLSSVEPWIKVVVGGPTMHIGLVLDDLYANRKGTLESDSEGALTMWMPLARSLDYAEWLRTATSGNCSVQVERTGYYRAI